MVGESMDKAFDEMLDRIVYAEDSAKTDRSRGKYSFRYRCPFCSEYIILAAVDSRERKPYFKHKKGGDHALCEAYTGNLQQGEFEGIIRRFLKHREIFYFNAKRFVFEFGVKFSEEEIKEYAEAGRNFSLRASNNKDNKDLYCEPITPDTFQPQTRRFFEVTEYTRDYDFIAGERKVTIHAFDKNDRLSFYRETLIKERYKKIVGEVLYLETTYIALSKEARYIAELKKAPGIQWFDGSFSFETMGRTFHGLKVQFHKTWSHAEGCLHAYRVEKLENFSVLWPPARLVGEALAVDGEEVYVKSSFPIKEFKNTTSGSYVKLADCPGIYTMNLFKDIQIREQNVDLTMIRQELDVETQDPPEVEEMVASRCFVAGDSLPEPEGDALILRGYDFYLFDDGCTPLHPGDSLRLSSQAMVAGYENRHLRQVVLPEAKRELDGEALLLDILRYYPKEEPFDFEPPAAWREKAYIAAYLDRCKKRGKINSLVKAYLTEGRL